MKLEFDPGEEKIAQAFEQIHCLWQTIFQLNARSEIDSFLLASIIDTHPAPEDVRERWQQMSSTWLASQFLKSMDPELMKAAKEEMTRRVKFWTDRLNDISTPQRKTEE